MVEPSQNDHLRLFTFSLMALIVTVFPQTSFITLSVNVSEPWYSGRGLQVLDATQKTVYLVICLKDAKPLQFDAAKADSEWVELLRKNMPSWSSFTHLASSVLALGTLMVTGLHLWLILPSIHSWKFMQSSIIYISKQ